jgi:hypothetical protein
MAEQLPMPNITVNARQGRFEGLQMGVAHRLWHTATNHGGRTNIDIPATHSGFFEFPRGTQSTGRLVYIQASSPNGAEFDSPVWQLHTGASSGDIIPANGANVLFIYPQAASLIDLGWTIERTGGENEYRFHTGSRVSARFYEYTERASGGTDADWTLITWNNGAEMITGSGAWQSDPVVIGPTVGTVRVRLAGGRDTANGRIVFPNSTTHSITDFNVNVLDIIAAQTRVNAMILSDLLQEDYNTAAAIRPIVEEWVELAKDDPTVTAVVNPGTFRPAVAGTVQNPSGTPGRYEFSVRLSKGVFSRDTVTLAFSINASPVHPSLVAVNDAARTIEAKTLDNVEQRLYYEEAAIKTYVENLVEAVLSEAQIIGVSFEVNTKGFKEAVAGTPGEPEGTNGEYVFTVDFGSDEFLESTAELTIEINATHLSGVEGVRLCHATIHLNKGAEVNLTPTVLPLGVNDTFTWHSSNPAAVTIDPATGLITAVSAGTATITVTSNATGHTAECIVVVGEISFEYFVYELPPGMSFDPETGAIHGIPTEPGKFLMAVTSNAPGQRTIFDTIEIVINPAA